MRKDFEENNLHLPKATPVPGRTTDMLCVIVGSNTFPLATTLMIIWQWGKGFLLKAIQIQTDILKFIWNTWKFLLHIQTTISSWICWRIFRLPFLIKPKIKLSYCLHWSQTIGCRMNHPLAGSRVPKYLLALNKFFMRCCLVPGTLMYLTRTCELKNKTTHLQYSGLAEWKGKCQSTEKSLSKYWTLFPWLYHLNWTFIRSLYYVKVVIISLRVSDLGGLNNKPPVPHCSLENCPLA